MTNFGDFLLTRNGYNRLTLTTLEEHQKTGGIGSAIAEIIAENNLDCSFKRMGFDDKFAYEYGWHKDILEADFLQIVFIKL